MKNVVTRVTEHYPGIINVFRIVKNIAALLFVVALVAIYFLLTDNEELKRTNTTLNSQLDSSAVKYKTLTNKYNETVVKNTALTTTAAEVKALSKEIFGLKDGQEKLVKKVQYLSKTTVTAGVNDTYVPFEKEPENTDGPVAQKDSIAVPQNFSLEDTGKKIAGTVTKDGVQIEAAVVMANIYQRGYTEKYGFLNLKRRTAVQAISDNPALEIKGLATYTVPHKQNAWNRWIKPVGCVFLGAAGTVLILK